MQLRPHSRHRDFMRWFDEVVMVHPDTDLAKTAEALLLQSGSRELLLSAAGFGAYAAAHLVTPARKKTLRAQHAARSTPTPSNHTRLWARDRVQDAAWDAYGKNWQSAEATAAVKEVRRAVRAQFKLGASAYEAVEAGLRALDSHLDLVRAKKFPA